MPKSLAGATLFVLLAAACRHRDGSERNAGDIACPAAWREAPATDPGIRVPQGSEVIWHVTAHGTQDYVCAVADAGSVAYAWKFTGPDAALTDCRGRAAGRHLASADGPTAPEWRSGHGAFVTAHKTSSWTPDPSAVPWLLLAVDHSDGEGPPATARFVQRTSTRGGIAPAEPCDARTVGEIERVPYDADYYFLR
ncbi:MAG: DUF3455 domain-containing protein [Polyangiaceae bacterium]